MNLKRILAAMIIGVFTFVIIPAGSYTFASTDPEPEIESTAEEYLICSDDPDAHFSSISARAVSSCALNFERFNNSKGIVHLEAYSTNKSNAMTSTIYLQKYNSGKKKFVNVSGVKSIKHSNSSPIYHSPSFSISKSGKYRIKAVVSDGSNTITRYRELS